jgi:hypothetical protein
MEEYIYMRDNMIKEQIFLETLDLPPIERAKLIERLYKARS